MSRLPETVAPLADEERAAAATDEAPPLGSWARLYALVLGELALLVVLFTLFARAFS